MSTVGGLDGRQCQDAAIVGVEGLRVAPGPGNRQQSLKLGDRGSECGCGGGRGLGGEGGCQCTCTLVINGQSLVTSGYINCWLCL